MPLSEDEQRILRQIEEQLQRDPGFGRNLHQRSQGNRRMLVVSGVAPAPGSTTVTLDGWHASVHLVA